jgi:hypothetical protein
MSRAYSTLPAELHLQIFLQIESYDTLISFLIAYPPLRPILRQYPYSIFSSLLRKELSHFQPTKTAGRSILVHALQQIHICRVYRRTRRFQIRYGMQHSEAELEGIRQDTMRKRKEAEEFFWEAKSVRIGGGSANDELRHWLGKVGTKCTGADGSERLLILSDETLQEMIESHETIKGIYEAFIRDVLPEVIERRIKAVAISYRVVDTSHPDEAVTGQLDSEIRAASALPVSDMERYRIIQAAYVLRYSVDLIRLVGPGQVSGIAINDLRKTIWNAYDTIWQLEAMTTIYEYLKSKLLENGQSIKCLEYHGKLESYEEEGNQLLHANDLKLTDDLDLKNLYFDNLLLEGGIDGLWKQHRGASTKSRPTKTSTSSCLPGGGLVYCGFLYGGPIQWILIPNTDMRYRFGGPIEDYRY